MTVTATDSDYERDGYGDSDREHLVWRALRGTIWGTVDLVKAAVNEAMYRKGVLVTKARMAWQRYKAARSFPEDFEPDPDEIPGAKWAPVRFTCLDCKRSWSTAKAFNDHFERMHRATRQQQDPDIRAGARMFTGRPHGKAKVRGGAQKRPPTAAPDKRSVWTKIGVKAMDSGAAQVLARAWREWGDSRPRGLSTIREHLLGMEQVHGTVAPDAIKAFKMHLVRLGFDPALLQNLARAEDEMAAAAARFSATVAVIEEALAVEIAAAKAAKSGSKPSQDVLAN